MILKLVGLFFLFILLRSLIRGYFLFKTIKINIGQHKGPGNTEAGQTPPPSQVVDAEYRVLKEE